MKKTLIASISSIAFTAILSQSAIAAFAVKGMPAPNWESWEDRCKRILADSTSDMASLKECGYVEKAVVLPDAIYIPPPEEMMVEEIMVEEITIRATLLFAFDSSVLTENAKRILDQHTEKYRNNGVLTSNVEVTGHADSTGPESYNQKLSERRAKAVAHYLQNTTNIADKNLDVYGRGELEPIESNITREGRQANRRVMIILTAEVTE